MATLFTLLCPAQVKLWAYHHENWKPFDVFLNASLQKESFDNVNISKKNFKFVMLITFYP